MKFDVALAPDDLQQIPDLARSAEAIGFDGLWMSETKHDPFQGLALAAEHTRRIQLGTAVAIAFARSPGALAYSAWDLARLSEGRFILGLGTQVKAHIERRFGMPWPESPAGKLRETLAALRALWSTWQTNAPLKARGEYFKLSLMSPFFSPGPIDHPEIPIYLAGVNPGMCRLAGEIADGLHVHPLHSTRYINEVVLPAIADGAQKTGRAAEAISLVVSAFVASDESQKAFVRSQIAFYASTPTYRRVMALHGWERAADELSSLARRQAWKAMAALVNDEMLETFAVVAPRERLPEALIGRYSGMADRLMLYQPLRPEDDPKPWAALAQAVRGI